MAVAATPYVLAGLGFTAGGIAAGSCGAWMMSVGMPMVPVFQSIGAAGMGAASTFTMGGAGVGCTWVGRRVYSAFRPQASGSSSESLEQLKNVSFPQTTV